MDILFLPPIYLITLVVSAIITGVTFDHINEKPFILASGTLYFIFTIGQLIYRIFENAMPDRLVGQFIYYLLFLIIVYLTRIVKRKIIG